MFPEKIEKMLEDANASTGDLLEIEVGNKKYKGILMPHHRFSGATILTIKLDNGYNVGLDIGVGAKIKVLKKKEDISRKKIELEMNKDKPTVAVLGTGGTIASYVEYETGAVHPAITAEEMVSSVPELTDICNVRAKVLFSIVSEDMKSSNWERIAVEVAEELNNGASGVIIPHGTDTLGYTSAALAFMLKNLTGAVILVGAQRSSDRPSSDATLNLMASARLASLSDLGEVVAVMHSGISDDSCYVHRGTKVRKMHTSRRDAFQSVNAEPIGKIIGERIELSDYRKRGGGKVEARIGLEPKVCLLYFYPGMGIGFIDNLSKNCRGIVIAGSGLGHISSEIIEPVKKVVEKGTTVVMTSQCLYGRVNMNVYTGGRELVEAGVISGEDMLPETAYVKLMWVLGQTDDRNEIKRLMETNLAGEISPRRKVWEEISGAKKE